MRFDVITVLPDLFAGVEKHGVVGRAHARALWALYCWNPRDQASDAYKTIDDRSYGGGPGMVMMAEPLERTLAVIRQAQSDAGVSNSRLVYLSPQGKPVTQKRIEELVIESAVTLLCGRYEGVDQRFLDKHVDEEVAVGEFVVSGGELPAMMLIDAAVRLLPGVLNDSGSALEDSFANGLLDFPHYTRPEVWDGTAVPSVLLSGHHREIGLWRRRQALLNTAQKRPDLIKAALDSGQLSEAERQFLYSQPNPPVID